MQPDRSLEMFEHSVAAPEDMPCVLQLYIAGTSPRSQKAVVNIRKICEKLQGGYRLQVIDIFQQPSLAKEEQIVAVPTLIKKAPVPKAIFIGDLSDIGLILASLES